MQQPISAWLNDLQTLQIGLAVAVVVVLILIVMIVTHRRSARQSHEDAMAQLTALQAREVQLNSDLRALEISASQHETKLEGQGVRLSELVEERDSLTDALHQARQAAAQLQSDLAQSTLRGEKDQEAAAREIATLKEMRQEMSDQFKLLSAETLRVQKDDLQKVHGEQLTALLNPFRDQVHRFQTELQARNKVLDEEGARLREQITFLHQRSEDISREAVNLTRALKGDKQRQGAWGEMVLERILEDSGLISGTHYDIQTSWRDDDGKQWRPDVVVKMPQGKVMVIDSKVSLNDYEAAVNSDDPVESAQALRRHVAAIRNHITRLSEKGYHRMDDGSVDYVLMFIPIEGAFSEALRADPTLASFAMELRVGMTTPTTLMLTLRTVDHIWAVERRESNAAEIAKRAGQLYDKVAGFADSMEAVGRALEQASRAHGQAIDRLSRGSGNVIRQVEMLRELGARNQKRIGMDHDGDPAQLEAPGAEAAE